MAIIFRNHRIALKFKETIHALVTDKLFSNFEEFKSQQDAKYVAYLFAKGGFSPSGVKIANPSQINAYREARMKIPLLSLLGGTYFGHHFESDLKVGYVLPIIQETIKAEIVKLPQGQDASQYPNLSELLQKGIDNGVLIQRFTKMSDPDYDIEMPEAEEEEEVEAEESSESPEKGKEEGRKDRR